MTEPPPTTHARSPTDVFEATASGAKMSSLSSSTSPKERALELRRRRNRESMRRARSRQRSEQERLETTIEQLENRLEQLLQRSRESDSPSSAALAAYSALLHETEHLRAQHDTLSELARKHAHFQERLEKLVEQERATEAAKQDADADADADAALLQPLLSWVTPATTEALVAVASARLLAVADVTDALVTTTQSLLGWQGKRTIASNWAHYTMRKSFPHERALQLATRTWDCTVHDDVAATKRVLAWANGTRVLHRLSDDAAVLARDMDVPNREDPAHPIRLRFILLVFRTELPDQRGFLVGTETLNVYGTTVDECLEQTAFSARAGMRSLTMYGFHFVRLPTGGCHVTLAGRSGDGSRTYAHKVLFEVLPSILRWENTFVAPILRVAG